MLQNRINNFEFSISPYKASESNPNVNQALNVPPKPLQKLHSKLFYTYHQHQNFIRMTRTKLNQLH